jgi:hypothetical protein
MNPRIESEPGPVKNRTTVERKSDREVVVRRTINGPARIVFEAFTKAEVLKAIGMKYDNLFISTTKINFTIITFEPGE